MQGLIQEQIEGTKGKTIWLLGFLKHWLYSKTSQKWIQGLIQERIEGTKQKTIRMLGLLR